MKCTVLKSWLRYASVVFASMLLLGICPAIALGAEPSQTVLSDWTEVYNLNEDDPEYGYSYGWRVNANVSVTDGIVSDVVVSARSATSYGVPRLHADYYNVQHYQMEEIIASAGIHANNPDSVDGVDVVSGATHTCDAIKKATKNALVKWNANVAQAQKVTDLVNAIASSPDKKSAVAEARAAYNAMSDPAEYVSPEVVKTLLEAESELAANDVINAIKAIDSSDDMQAATAAARSAYDKLSADAKALVPDSVYKLLTDAEEKVAEAQAELNLANATVTVSPATVTFTGAAAQPGVAVVSKNGSPLIKDVNYTVQYKDNSAPGTGTVIVTGKAPYTGSKSATFKIAQPAIKAKQTIAPAKATYTVKYKKVKKKNQTIAVKFKASGGGKITYAAAKSGKVSIAANGKVTVKKGAKKKTYTLNVKVTAAANGNYAATTVTVPLKVKVA